MQGTVKYFFDKDSPGHQADSWIQKIGAGIKENQWYLFTKLNVSRDPNTSEMTLSYKVKEEEELDDFTRKYEYMRTRFL
jgi:hypothetical protein